MDEIENIIIITVTCGDGDMEIWNGYFTGSDDDLTDHIKESKLLTLFDHMSNLEQPTTEDRFNNISVIIARAECNAGTEWSDGIDKPYACVSIWGGNFTGSDNDLTELIDHIKASKQFVQFDRMVSVKPSEELHKIKQ